MYFGEYAWLFYGLWSKNNEYRVTIELVQKNSLHKKENPENLPEHFSENVIKAGAMNRNSWKSKNIIVLRYCWDSMWQSRFFCTILRETCQKPERWQTAHDKTGFQKSWTGASEYWSVCGKILWKNGSYRSGGWVWTGGYASGTNRIIDTIYDTMYNISRRV